MKGRGDCRRQSALLSRVGLRQQLEPAHYQASSYRAEGPVTAPLPGTDFRVREAKWEFSRGEKEASD